MGFSRDDPDGDGHLNEISEGDLDLAEWFMLNAPRPAFAGTPAEYASGVELMGSLGCATCHQPDWTILAADNTFTGDRRFFDLDVRWSVDNQRLEGSLERLYDRQGDAYVLRRGAFDVEGIFTDLAHHEMGPGFEEIDFGGTRNSTWRTPPLWGVGSGFPWGHDGQSLTIEDAINRHGGEAQQAADAWAAASPEQRASLLRFLSQLVLYDVEQLPTDVNGDGEIVDDFMVAGVATGFERFNAEWLFATPVRIQGLIRNSSNEWIRSFAAANLSQAYGLTLPLRIDRDLDGWPDVWDAAPLVPGFKDGVQ